MSKFKYGVDEICDKRKHADWFSLLVVAGLATCIVGGISYAAYLFIDATRISDSAGIHITRSLSLAADDLRGNLYSDENRGIKDWMIQSDNANGFEMKHPNDWEKQASTNSFLHLKKYKDSSAKKSLLLATMDVGSVPLQDGQSMKDAALKKGIVWQDDWREEIIGGRAGVRTGKVKTAGGLYKDVIFWNNRQDRQIFYLEVTYFTNQQEEFEDIFTNVITEFKFI